MAVLIPAQGGGSAISNGQIINGVANFWQTSAPTTRVGGAALVAGDLWYKPSNGTEWFWNGTHWLSFNLYSQTVFRDASVSVTTNFPSTVTEYPFSAETDKIYFLEEITYRVWFDAATDISNYWALEPNLFRADGLFQSLSAALGIDTSTPVFGTSGVSGTIAAGFTFVPSRSSVLTYVSFGVTFTKVGSPGDLRRPAVSFFWREVS